MVKIVKCTTDSVVYKTTEGDIIKCPLTEQARAILQWYYKNIPANNK